MTTKDSTMTNELEQLKLESCPKCNGAAFTRGDGIYCAPAQNHVGNTKPSAVDGAIEVPDWLAQKWDDGFFTAPSVIVTRQQFIAQQAIAWDRQNRATKPAVSDATFEELLHEVIWNAYLQGNDDGEKAECWASVSSIKVQGVEALRQHVHALQSPIPAMPEGWVPLTIEYEPGYPEDVAFGPPIMMERLKKWLDKYYAMLRQPKPEVEAKPVVWMLKEDFDALTKPDDDESLPDGVEAVVFNRRPDVGQWQPLYTSPPSSDLSAQVASVAEDVSADTFLDIPVFLRKKNPNYQGD
jgi:hypothetical protein